MSVPHPAGNPELDPTHALDGWRAPTEPPPLDLSELLHPTRRTELSTTRMAQLRARGWEMRDVEDVEITAFHAPAAAPKPLDLDGLARALARTAEQAAPRPPAPDPRLLQRWLPSAWVALSRRVSGASSEVVQGAAGPIVENRAPQWLYAIWPPQRLDAPLLGRWPECAGLLEADDAPAAARQMLTGLPAESRLWLAELEADWALLAELVLHQQPGLRAGQAQALRELAEVERRASFARLNDAYVGTSGSPVRRRPGPAA